VFVFEENGRGDVEAGLLCDGCDEAEVSPVVFVVIVLAPAEVTVAVVVETWAEATSEPGDTASYVTLDFAWNVGFVRARNAEKKLAKKGRLVGIMSDDLADTGEEIGIEKVVATLMFLMVLKNRIRNS